MEEIKAMNDETQDGCPGCTGCACSCVLRIFRIYTTFEYQSAREMGVCESDEVKNAPNIRASPRVFPLSPHLSEVTITAVCLLKGFIVHHGQRPVRLIVVIIH